MVDPDKRRAIFLLHEKGMGIREIGRRLGVHRNTVREIIELEGGVPTKVRKDKIHIDPDLLRRLYEKCEGWRQRIYEILVEEYKINPTYSTLTRRLRELGIGRVEKTRCDQVPDVPGAEMQHDTSPYTVDLGGKPTKIIASLLYLRYSKRHYLRFYPVFNRFKMKCFFHEALTFWKCTAPICIIDNTNLARLRGTGPDAVMVPEMAAFAKQLGFEFLCHELKHPNRKAGDERGFYTVKSNFFPGRTFRDWEDLNRQAFDWATVRIYYRPISKTHLIPAKLFEHEQAYLKEVPPLLPAPYLIHERGTDQYGYAAFDGNFYWVPGMGREDVRVLEYSDQLKIYRGREFLAEYKLPPYGVKNARFSPEGFPKPRFQPNNRKKPTDEEEKRLRALGEVVGAYLDFALKPKGVQRHRFVRDLFRSAQQMSSSLFVTAVERALKYRITCVETIRRIAVMYMTEGVETTPSADVDETFRDREAYEEGRLTDEPDLSRYDDLLEEDNG